MLSLQKITITHYKNYEVQSFDFEKSIIGICGSNGKGKTNLLDAVYYSCFTKSYFPGSDTLNIHFNQEGFRIESSFVNNLLHYKVVCIQRNNCKKELYLNDVLYEKLSHHIGLLPAVMIAPDDIEIIKEPVNATGILGLMNQSYTADTTFVLPTMPSIPTNLLSTSKTTTTVSLVFNDNSNNETLFELYRSASNLNNYRLLATISGGAGSLKSFIDSNLFSNTNY